MTLRKQIVQEAFRWQGTPYHHQCALRGIGSDCVGLLIGVAKAVGLLLPSWAPPAYSPEFHLHHNAERLQAVLEELGCLALPLDALHARQPGDLLTFQYGRVASHTAILVSCHPDYIIHAARKLGRVVHQRLDAKLLARVRGCYSFPGVGVPCAV